MPNLVFNYYFIELLALWSLSSLSVTPVTWMPDLLQSNKSLRLCSFYLSMFCCSHWVVSIILSFFSLTFFLCLSISLIFSSVPPFCYWTQLLCFVFVFFSSKIPVCSLNFLSWEFPLLHWGSFSFCFKYIHNCLKHF